MSKFKYRDNSESDSVSDSSVSSPKSSPKIPKQTALTEKDKMMLSKMKDLLSETQTTKFGEIDEEFKQLKRKIRYEY